MIDFFAALTLFGQAAVIDGDTIELRSPIAPPARIRFQGVSAPERHTPAGKAATAWLIGLAQGQWVYCDLQIKRNGWPKKSWARFVGRCRMKSPPNPAGAEDIDLGVALIAAGHGKRDR